jgi:hypothetical protein
MGLLRSLPRFFFLLACALTSGGCFQFASVLAVKGDGSGTIQQRLLFTAAALTQMRGLSLLGRRGVTDFDPVSEEQARAAAARLGPGVTYVSSTPIMTGDGQGRDILYAFTDINQLHLSQTPPAPGGVTVRAQSLGTDQQISFSLTKAPGGHALLRVSVPRPTLPGGTALGQSGRGEFSPSQVAMFKQMVVGARLSIVVEPVGTLIKASSPYVAGQRVTLIDVDFDQLLQDDAVLTRLQEAKSEEEAKVVLADLPRVKVNLDPTITIEFAPAP